MHLLLTLDVYEGNGEEACEYAGHRGVSAYDLIVRMQEMLEDAPEDFRQVIRDFREESEEELFDTAEACEAFAKAHVDELLDGSMGGNLLSKYSMLGRFFTTAATVDFLGLAIARTTGQTLGAAPALDAVLDYLRAVLLHVPFAEALEARPRWESRYDVEAWREDGYLRPLEECALPGPVTFGTDVEPARKAAITTRLETFGENPQGMGKFTRTMFARDLRRTVTALSGLPTAEGARS